MASASLGRLGRAAGAAWRFMGQAASTRRRNQGRGQRRGIRRWPLVGGSWTALGAGTSVPALLIADRARAPVAIAAMALGPALAILGVAIVIAVAPFAFAIAIVIAVAPFAFAIAIVI